MKLSLEIPTAYLRDWAPLCDLDFVLAHRVLEDETYAEFFRERELRRELILDNSMHELGRPLSSSELLEAARRVKADYVIAPDMLKEPEKNYAWFKETHRLLSDEFKIAVVMCGRSPEERVSFLNAVRSADMLCLPFREDRLAWGYEQRAVIRQHWDRIHLLGVNDLLEIRMVERLFSVDTNLSVDTGKPIKWGVAGERMSLMKPVRGAPTTSLDLLSIRNLTCAQTEHVLWNIAYLRRFV
jgi:hypothetical protein